MYPGRSSRLTGQSARLTANSGAEEDGGGYGVFGGTFTSLVVVFFALAVSVNIWKVVAFFVMEAALLDGGISVVAPRTRSLAADGRASARRRLTGGAIDDALPASAYERDPSGSAAACSVCLEELQGGEAVRRLPVCRHLYHARSIEAWLHLHTTCPLCRSDLLAVMTDGTIVD